MIGGGAQPRKARCDKSRLSEQVLRRLILPPASVPPPRDGAPLSAGARWHDLVYMMSRYGTRSLPR